MPPLKIGLAVCLVAFWGAGHSATVERLPPGHQVASYFKDVKFAHFYALELCSFERAKALGEVREFVLVDYNAGDFYYFRFGYIGETGDRDFFTSKNYELLLRRKVRIPDYYRAHLFQRTMLEINEISTISLRDQRSEYDYFTLSTAGNHAVRINRSEIPVIYDFVVLLADNLIEEMSAKDLERFVYRFVE